MQHLQDQMTADTWYLNICGQTTAAVAKDFLSPLLLQLKHCMRQWNHTTQMDTWVSHVSDDTMDTKTQAVDIEVL